LARRILYFLGIIPFLLCSGCGVTSFLITPVSAPTELTDVKVEGGGPGKIAIIEVEGTLANAVTDGLLSQGENPLNLFMQELDKAARDSDVKAVVLRVNSPGGSVTTSDTMYDAVLRFKAKTHKPVIASAQELDASGAYYVSCAADKIVATPTSLVGCIGVIFDSFDLKDLMDKLGVQSVAIKSAELKDMGSMFKHMTDHEKEVEQALVDEFFARFKAVVMAGRPIKDGGEITKVSDGRVFSGQDSVALGLVDQVGQSGQADVPRLKSRRDPVQTCLWVQRLDLRQCQCSRPAGTGSERADQRETS
jgi:protease-4